MKDTNSIEEGFKLLVRAVGASVPGAASIASAWTEVVTDNRLKRLEKLADEVVSQIRADVSGTWDVDEKDQSLPSLIRMVVRTAEFETRREKLSYYAHLLSHSARSRADGERLLEHHFVELIERLGPVHLQALTLISQDARRRLWQIQEELGLTEAPQGPEIVISILVDLMSNALLARESIAPDAKLSWLKNELHWTEEWRAATYKVTSLGALFLTNIGQNKP